MADDLVRDLAGSEPFRASLDAELRIVRGGEAGVEMFQAPGVGAYRVGAAQDAPSDLLPRGDQPNAEEVGILFS